MGLTGRATLDAIRCQETQGVLRVETKRSRAGPSAKQLRCILNDDRPSVGGAHDGSQDLLLRIVKYSPAGDRELAELSAHLVMREPGACRHPRYQDGL